jgi:hypothetical protein
MAYQITKTFSNGYRCSCCARDWDYSEWADTLEEALEQVPIELVDGEPHSFNGDVEITEVTVKDGSTGEDIAWGRASWSQGYEKYSGYDYTLWSGYRPDSGSFSVVYKGREKVDKTWKEVCDELAEKRRQKDLEKAQRDLADAQKRIASLSKP